MGIVFFSFGVLFYAGVSLSLSLTSTTSRVILRDRRRMKSLPQPTKPTLPTTREMTGEDVKNNNATSNATNEDDDDDDSKTFFRAKKSSSLEEEEENDIAAKKRRRLLL